MTQKTGKKAWVTSKLEQIEMVDTSTITAGCMGSGPGSKMMNGNENLGTCSVGS